MPGRPASAPNDNGPYDAAVLIVRAIRRTASSTSAHRGRSTDAAQTAIGPAPTGPVRPGSLATKIADQRNAERGGKMQQAGIDADHERRAGNQLRHRHRAAWRAGTRARGGAVAIRAGALALGLGAARQHKI